MLNIKLVSWVFGLWSAVTLVVFWIGVCADTQFFQAVYEFGSVA